MYQNIRSFFRNLSCDQMVRSVCLGLATSFIFMLGGCDLGNIGGGEQVSVKVEKAHKRNDGPALWKVSDHNSTLYLYGTVHLIQDDMVWLKNDIRAAMDEVGTVFFEIPDTDKANLEASILQRQYGLYESGDRLSDHLDGAVQKYLAAAAYNIDLAPERLEIFKPWLVTDMLIVAGAEKAGFKSANSADAKMRALAKAGRKDIRALDDMKTYLEAIALQPDYIQEAALEETVRKFDSFAGDLAAVNAAWVVGNTKLLVTQMLEPAREKSPETFNILFTKRNAKWAKTLDQFLQGDETGLVVVGIGHLIGENGLPNRFKELGYDVERVRRFDLPNE